MRHEARFGAAGGAAAGIATQTSTPRSLRSTNRCARRSRCPSTTSRRSPAPAWRATARCRCRRATPCACARCRSRRAGDLRAGRAGAVPVVGRDGRRDRPGRRASPRSPSCATHPVMLAAARLCGADEVYRMGGAQAIAALAHGTESVAAVDVIVGPGSLYAQEAKRQVAGTVGIDGFAGPSDLVVIADRGRRRRSSWRSTCSPRPSTAPAPSSPSSAPTRRCSTPSRRARRATPARPCCALVHDRCRRSAFAEAFAPEHLQLVGAAAEALAPRVTRAGCLFVGAGAGDRVRRLRRGLQPRAADRGRRALRLRAQRAPLPARDGGGPDRRRPRRPRWRPPGAAIARAEGFEAHAASMDARMRAHDDRAPLRSPAPPARPTSR